MVGFNIKAARPILAVAAALQVPVVLNNVIYRLIEDIKERVIDLLPNQYDTRVLGEGTIQQVFQFDVKGGAPKAIAGCRVTNGSVKKKAKMKLMRNKTVLFEGESKA